MNDSACCMFVSSLRRPNEDGGSPNLAGSRHATARFNRAVIGNGCRTAHSARNTRGSCRQKLSRLYRLCHLLARLCGAVQESDFAMDAFESLISMLLRHQGYWTTPSFKVELTKEEKRNIGRTSSPRWELDLVAYKGSTNEVLA